MKKQKILITGSSRGIGAALAKLCNNSGFEVIIHGRSKSNHLLKFSKELNSDYIYFDVRNNSEIKNAIKGISSLDALVNSAGINISKPFEQLTSEDWNEIFSSNVFGMVNVIRNLLPQLRQSNNLARIVNLASMKGTYSAVGRIAYASSKAAVINLTHGLAKELSPNILVNCVSPGFTSTDMTDKTMSKRIENQIDSILLKRIAQPKEIAEVILFLCSNKCTYMTGQNILVDGGFSIKNV